MERAGLQPDGITYSVLHGMWLRIGNLPQAVGALAQAKQRAVQRHGGSRGSGSHVSAAGSCDATFSSFNRGEPLWDPALRDEEISRHLRSMVTVNGNEEESQRRRPANLDQLCVPSHRSGAIWSALRSIITNAMPTHLVCTQATHALFSDRDIACMFVDVMAFDRYSYFAELRRQALASTTVYNAMIDTCQQSAGVKNLLSQMEADGIEANLHTYVALHRAWYNTRLSSILVVCVPVGVALKFLSMCGWCGMLGFDPQIWMQPWQP